ncbi:MAG: glycosyltransferase family 4 protein [Verrucomicrobiia bacterium]
MKILIHCPLPFALAHGGHQIQIERTQAALQALGLQVEPLRWWDEKQTADLVHFFGRMPAEQIKLAHQKGLKVVMAELLTATGSRSPGQLRRQKTIKRVMEHVAPRHFVASFNWESYQLADACVALTPWEAHLMRYLFGAPAEKVHVVPNGVEDVFFQSPAAQRGKWLVCTATIAGRKRVLELAEAAVFAKIPVWVIGKAYSETDPYAQRFFALSRQHPQIVRYEGAISDRSQLAGIYREARGFVLPSTMESLSLSALEAAACDCPLLLSDLPWARSTFGEHAMYCPITLPERMAEYLRTFYDQAPSLKPPPKPLTWLMAGQQLKELYEQLSGTPCQRHGRD